MATISSAISHSITLGTTGSYASPLSITASGSIANSGTGNAVYGLNTQAWTLDNAGGITATGAFAAVALLDGGSVGNSGYITGGTRGVRIAGAAGTITNTGTIAATGTGGIGVYLAAGGTITNGSTSVTTARIAGAAGTAGAYGYSSGAAGGVGGAGVSLSGGGSLTNSGTIAGGAGGAAGSSYDHGGIGGAAAAGVTLSGGGAIANTGAISGGGGGHGGNTFAPVGPGGVGGAGGAGIVLSSAASIVNTGTISGGQGGIGGTSFLGTAASGTAGAGIVLSAGGTVTDAGTISGSRAITFGGTGSNLLVLEAGYKLIGAVQGSGSAGASNTLELAGSVGSAVTVNYNALTLSHFQDVLFAAGGYDTLKVANTSGTLPVTLQGFTATSDIVDLTAIGTSGTISNVDTANDRVTVTGSNGSLTLQLDTSDGANFTTMSDGSSGTELIACFGRGTRILAEAGEVPVEDLAIGDNVITLDGAARPIRWIGRRAYDGRFVASNRAVLPIRITAGALASGVPARDLFLSPAHALYIDGVLAMAGHLVNGATIVQEERVERVEYFHLEFAAQHVIFAEGAASESYVDCDNRFMFVNGAEYALDHLNDDRPTWDFCAPRVEADSDALTAIRAALAARAARHPSADAAA